jgi:hypothetical protein
VISTVAFCPHPPALVPELTAGAQGELAPLRAACTEAIGRLAGAGRLVVLGSGPEERSYGPTARGTLAGYGRAVETGLGAPGGHEPPELPLSLTVGAWLIGQVLGPDSGAVGVSVGPEPAGAASRGLLDRLDRFDIAAVPDVALLVMGDGSARRRPSGPGSFDPRAADFDATVLAALGRGEPDVVAGLDPVLGDGLLAAGVAAWRAAGHLLAGTAFDAEVLYADDPYGVGYFVAVWTARV